MDEFETSLESAKLQLEPRTIQTLREYCRLLWERNEQINLTRHTTFAQFVARDLVDSVQLSLQLGQGETILDLGSGGGAPGLLLAILRPDLKVSLSDSIKKKAKVLQELSDRLGVHVEVYDCRGESLLEDFRYDTITARAVGPLAKLLPLLNGKWFAFSRLLVVKGPSWQDEIAAARSARVWTDARYDLKQLAEYPVPGEGWMSCILEIRWRS